MGKFVHLNFKVVLYDKSASFNSGVCPEAEGFIDPLTTLDVTL